VIPSALGACAAQRETSYSIVVNKSRNPPECAGPSYPNDSIDVQLPFQPTTVAAERRLRPDEDGHRLTVDVRHIPKIEHQADPAVANEALQRVS
jgi:hypothetical protein